MHDQRRSHGDEGDSNKESQHTCIIPCTDMKNYPIIVLIILYAWPDSSVGCASAIKITKKYNYNIENLVLPVLNYFYPF